MKNSEFLIVYRVSTPVMLNGMRPYLGELCEAGVGKQRNVAEELVANIPEMVKTTLIEIDRF